MDLCPNRTWTINRANLRLARSRRLPTFLLLLAGTALPGSTLPGCSRGNANVAAVDGTVAYAGRPVATGSLSFLPAQGRPAYGKIADGKIVDVTTNQKGDGAPVGKCQVTVQAYEPGKDVYSVGKPLVPVKYNKPGTSRLIVDILPGQVNHVILKLTD